jgi:hypothetical protein
MNLKLSKLTGRIVLVLLVASIAFTSCNNKKKSDKPNTEDTAGKKPTAPGD